GPLIRDDTVSQNSLNGVWVRPDASGVAQASDAIVYPNNPVKMGGVQNYVFDATLPYILTSLINVGTQLQVDNNGSQLPLGSIFGVMNRLSILPGRMIKSQRGAGIEVVTDGSSLIIGPQTYIQGWQAGATMSNTANTPGLPSLPVSDYAPVNADGTPNVNFKANSTDVAQVLFTSLYDNTSSTTYTNPTTGKTNTIVAANDATNSNGANQPTPGNVPSIARWGSVTYDSGSYGTVSSATFQYGGGPTNVVGGTVTRNVLSFLGASGNSRAAIVNNTTGQI
ncbi:hypothetical protein ACYOEI_40855, partial [Singulisphaera rosea]